MVGLFLLRTSGSPPDGGPLLARIEGALYVLAFSDRPRAQAARRTLGVPDAALFYVCDANRSQVLDELRAAGARGFITDYDASSATFSGAGALPFAA